MSPSDSKASNAIPARQARSRDTARRIVAAARKLMASRDIDETSVAEIARAADISVGGFYARFPSKQALLLHLCDEGFVSDMIEMVEDRLRPERWSGATAGDVIRGYIELSVRGFREHKAVLQQVTLNTRTSPDHAFRERVQRFNRTAHDRFRALLLARRDQLGVTDPRTAVDLGLIFVSAAMREVILFGHTRPDFVAIDDDRLTRELTDAYCAYLQTPSPFIQSDAEASPASPPPQEPSP